MTEPPSESVRHDKYEDESGHIVGIPEHKRRHKVRSQVRSPEPPAPSGSHKAPRRERLTSVRLGEGGSCPTPARNEKGHRATLRNESEGRE